MRGFPMVIAAGVWGAGVLLTAMASAAEPAVRLQFSDDGHLRPKIRERLPEEVIPPRVRFGQSYRVYSFPDSITKVAKVNHALSRLCQRGAFIQQVDAMYWAQTPDRRLGVAFSGGANLNDPQGRRQKAEVYFFDGQDAVCTVYVAKQEAVMARFVAPGSRLPVLGPAGIPAPQPVKTTPGTNTAPGSAPGGPGATPDGRPYR